MNFETANEPQSKEVPVLEVGDIFESDECMYLVVKPLRYEHGLLTSKGFTFVNLTWSSLVATPIFDTLEELTHYVSADSEMEPLTGIYRDKDITVKLGKNIMP